LVGLRWNGPRSVGSPISAKSRGLPVSRKPEKTSPRARAYRRCLRASFISPEYR
jgi:hypothetical protein